jgi:hexokinase
MLYTIQSLHEYSDNLIKEIQASASGKKNSIAYQVNPIPTNQQANIDKYQVITIGGSHLESALVSKKNNMVKILSFEETELPQLRYKQTLLDTIKPFVADDIDLIVLNFAYPLEPSLRDGKLDGKLLKSVKAHALEGLVGEFVGKTIEEFIYQDLGRNVSVNLCNDTLGLALAGLHYHESFTYRNTIAGVVGTGYNFGLFKNEKEFVNLESGNFDKFDSTHSGDCIDSLSDNPFAQRFEKEVGGAYLHKHFNLIAREEMLDVCIHSTKELSDLAEGQGKRENKIAQKVLMRAASLVATQIHALYNLQRDTFGLSDDDEFLVLAEGSVLWKAHDFLPMVEDYLDQLCDMDNEDAENIRIEHVENSGIIGAAYLV